MSEFTGERVIPGQVNEDLWAEHFARYAFAKRFTLGKRVLDLGCGTGYGTAELADRARLTVGADLATEAIAYASTHFPGAQFLQCSAVALPFPSGSFDVATAFEVIEHLTDWSSMLAEARRVLRPDGLLIVSTPNKLYYAEARGSSGPNPYHQHEFEFEEFRAALAGTFPQVDILLQDRLEAFAFHRASASPADGYVTQSSENPAHANFFVGICSRSPVSNTHPFVYVPKASNLLRERENHIRLLEGELVQVRLWLEETMGDRDHLIAKYSEVEANLEERNRWALQLEANWKASQTRIVKLQEDFQAEQQHAAAAIASLTAENLRKTRWALDTGEQLSTAVRQLEETSATLVARTESLQQLDAEFAESTRRFQAIVVEHTEKAAHLDDQLRQLTAQIEMMRHSRWLKLGRMFGVGPDLGQP